MTSGISQGISLEGGAGGARGGVGGNPDELLQFFARS